MDFAGLASGTDMTLPEGMTFPEGMEAPSGGFPGFGGMASGTDMPGGQRPDGNQGGRSFDGMASRTDMGMPGEQERGERQRPGMAEDTEQQGSDGE